MKTKAGGKERERERRSRLMPVASYFLMREQLSATETYSRWTQNLEITEDMQKGVKVYVMFATRSHY